MGLGGFVLGGALAGVGKGMAMQAEQNALERREARLAAARAAERAEDRQWQKEDAIQANNWQADRDQRLHNNRIVELGENAENETALAQMQSGAKPFDTQYDYDKGEVVHFFHDPKTNGVRQVRSKINTQKPANPDEPEVVTPQVDAEGNPVVFVRQGGTVTPQRIPGVKLPPKGSGDGEGGKRKLKVAGTNWAGQPYKVYDDGTIEGAQDIRSYDQLKGPDKQYADQWWREKKAKDRTRQGGGQAAKTISRSQLEADAKAEGMTYAQAEAKAKALGFTIR